LAVDVDTARKLTGLTDRFRLRRDAGADRADEAADADSATGTFHDDFQQRAAAGLEAQTADRAQVLVAVATKTSSAGAPEQQSRAWRMRVDVQRDGNGAKVDNVVFVP
jgi:Mce-associated membrane protein